MYLPMIMRVVARSCVFVGFAWLQRIINTKFSLLTEMRILATIWFTMQTLVTKNGCESSDFES